MGGEAATRYLDTIGISFFVPEEDIALTDAIRRLPLLLRLFSPFRRGAGPDRRWEREGGYRGVGREAGRGPSSSERI